MRLLFVRWYDAHRFLLPVAATFGMVRNPPQFRNWTLALVIGIEALNWSLALVIGFERGSVIGADGGEAGAHEQR